MRSMSMFKHHLFQQCKDRANPGNGMKQLPVHCTYTCTDGSEAMYAYVGLCMHNYSCKELGTMLTFSYQYSLAVVALWCLIHCKYSREAKPTWDSPSQMLPAGCQMLNNLAVFTKIIVIWSREKIQISNTTQGQGMIKKILCNQLSRIFHQVRCEIKQKQDGANGRRRILWHNVMRVIVQFHNVQDSKHQRSCAETFTE